MKLVYLSLFINALVAECVWQHITKLSNSERKHVSWHGAIGYGPSQSRMRKRDMSPKEENLKEFGG